MSAIATFHLLPRTELDALLKAATPEAAPRSRAVAFFTKKLEQPTLEEFLASRARPLTPFPHSGHAFTSLDFLLEPHGTAVFGNTDLADESARLSTVVEGTCVLFDHTSAQALLGRLSGVALGRGEIAAYLESEYGDGNNDAVDAIEAAFDAVKTWLSAVTPGWLGLLRVG